MYTLRKITKDGLEMNFNLGNSYTLVTKERNSEAFEKDMKAIPYVDIEERGIYGIVWSQDSQMNLLYDYQQSYIMTESGKTFSNVSKR